MVQTALGHSERGGLAANDSEAVSNGGPPPIQHRARTYQAFPGAQYILPCDEEEQARLELQHRVLQRAIGGRLVIPPLTLQPGDHVLDCGTGSGIWLLDLASQESPDIVFRGIDIESRLFPVVKPPNVTFSVGTTTQLPAEWDNQFKLVNQRLLIAALTSSEWPRVLKEVRRTLVSGGWVQLLEAKRWGAEDGQWSAKHRKLLNELFAAKRLVIDCSVQLPHFLKEAGFGNVHVEEYRIPAGSWAGTVGIETRDNFIGVFRGMKTPILNAGGFGYVTTEDEYDQWMTNMAEEWDTMEGTTVDICVCFAQKMSQE